MNLYGVKIPDKLSPNLFNDIYFRIEEKQQIRIKKFLHYGDRLRGLFAEILVLITLNKLFDIDIDKIVIKRDEFGKPYLKDFLDVHYNISHSESWIVMAVDRTPIGIDIERIIPIDYAIAKRFFSEIENQTLETKANEEKVNFFYTLWTLKESYIKKIGKGLSIPLNSFSIIYDNEITIESGKDRNKHYFKQYSIDDGYKLSVCAISNDFPERVSIIEYEELVADFLYYFN